MSAADPRNWAKTSVALIACDGNGRGTILECHGPHIEYEIECVGRADTFTSLGGRSQPAGLWVWEGTLHASTDYWGEHDSWLEGSLRELTKDELDLLEGDDELWDDADWLIP